MELSKAIETRHSVRKFTQEPVSRNDLQEIIRLAGYAPSINNYQPWKYIAITNRELLNDIAAEVTREIAKMPENSTRMSKQIKNQVAWFSTFFCEAPMLLALAGQAYESELEHGVQLSHDEINQLRNYPDLQSAGASVQNLLLAATEKGYGTCWMTGPLFARDAIEGMLNITDPWKLITFVAMGKPANTEQKGKVKRNLADEIVYFE